MIALALLVTGAAWYKFQRAQTAYSEIWLGASTSEIQYGFGNPERRSRAGADETWEYVGDGSVRRVLFREGRVVQAGCAAQGGQCPNALGIDTTAMEDLVFSRLGMPTRQHIAQGTKLLEYGDLGLIFELQRFQVVRIAISRANGNIAEQFGRFLLAALP